MMNRAIDYVSNYPIKVIGSYALVHNFNNLRIPTNRIVIDLDIICSRKTALKIIRDYGLNINKDEKYIINFYVEETLVECLLTDDQKSLQTMFDLNPNWIVDLDTLYCLKRGHIHRKNKDWEKHMKDLCDIKENLRYETSDYLWKLHRKCTNERLGDQKLPSLNKTKEEFFDDNVKKYIDHDIIHEVVAYEDVPAYTKMQLKGNSVKCHYNLWRKMANKDKINAVAEEVTVIAIERHLLPVAMGESLPKFNLKESIDWALMRICTTLSSGWFRDYSINNYSIVKSYIDKNKVNHNLQTVLNHIKHK